MGISHEWELREELEGAKEGTEGIGEVGEEALRGLTVDNLDVLANGERMGLGRKVGLITEQVGSGQEVETRSWEMKEDQIEEKTEEEGLMGKIEGNHQQTPATDAADTTAVGVGNIGVTEEREKGGHKIFLEENGGSEGGEETEAMT